jgi:hypothetical protein
VKVKVAEPEVEVVKGDPLAGEDFRTVTRVIERVEHVAPTDADDDGIPDAEDPCIGPCPAPEPAPAATGYAGPAPAPTSSGGCPASMAAEADSPTDVNPASGAEGCYQVIPSTAAAMGAACADVNAPSCVAAICASQGNGAWSESGATPCG